MDIPSFQTQVIERSKEVPVLVDFWAEWCGPCKILGPVIEELAEEANGKWELVKVDTEESEELSREFQIMSIPAVKLFSQGEVKAEFVGALPKYQIQKWLEEHLPHQGNTALLAVHAFLDQGNYSAATNKLTEIIEKFPDFVEAKIMLAREWIWADPDKVPALIESIKPGQKFFEESEDIKTLLELKSNDLEGDTSSNMLLEARKALEEKNFEATLQSLIEAIMKNKTFADEIARRSCIALFHYLGEDHPLSKKYRPRFSMALY